MSDTPFFQDPGETDLPTVFSNQIICLHSLSSFRARNAESLAQPIWTTPYGNWVQIGASKLLLVQKEQSSPGLYVLCYLFSSIIVQVSEPSPTLFRTGLVQVLGSAEYCLGFLILCFPVCSRQVFTSRPGPTCSLSLI